MVFLGSIIGRILGQPLQDYPGVQVGANVHVSDLAYAYDIGLCTHPWWAAPSHPASWRTLGGCSSQTARAPKISAEFISFRIPSPAILSLDAMIRSILLYSCETWPVRVTDERVLAVFVNDSIRRILRVRRRDCVPSVELRLNLSLTSIPAQLIQRRPDGELIKDLLLPTPPRTWRRQTGGQLKTRATTIKADLESLSGPRIFGYARWRKDFVKVSSELVQDCIITSLKQDLKHYLRFKSNSLSLQRYFGCHRPCFKKFNWI